MKKIFTHFVYGFFFVACKTDPRGITWQLKLILFL